MVRNYRKPLVVCAPKMLLRHPSCVSKLGDLTSGTTFKPVMGDSEVDSAGVKKVVFACGKHYYTLKQHREASQIKDTALVRVEVSLGLII